MPPKKSDQRKSDVSAPRFALKDDTTLSTTQDDNPSPSQQQPQQKRQSTGTTDAPPPESPSQPESEKKDGKEREKDKDKDKEKDKDKDKEGHQKDAITIEDLTLPKSIITRLAKGVLPANTQIQANAVLGLSKSTTVFISYLASHANEHTINAGKKTILPADVFKALEDTEFDFLKDRLEAEFAKFNAIQTEKRTSYRNKVKASKADTSVQDAEMADVSTNDVTAADASTASASVLDPSSSVPRSKKQRIDPVASGADGAGAAVSQDGEEHDDAETEDDEHIQDEEDDQDSDEEEAEEDDEEPDEDDQRTRSGDETQDALEERNGTDEHDEALDGDESD